MLLPFQNVLIIRFRAKNTSGTEQNKKIKLQLNGGITKNLKDWANWIPPMEENNNQEFDFSRNAIIYSAKNSKAHLLQSVTGKVDKVDRFGIEKTMHIVPNAETEFYFLLF